MATSKGNTRDAFDAHGNKLEQLKASIRVFRHAFPALNRSDAEAHLLGMEDAAECLENSFIDLEKAQKSDPAPDANIGEPITVSEGLPDSWRKDVILRAVCEIDALSRAALNNDDDDE